MSKYSAAAYFATGVKSFGGAGRVGSSATKSKKQHFCSVHGHDHGASTQVVDASTLDFVCAIKAHADQTDEFGDNYQEGLVPGFPDSSIDGLSPSTDCQPLDSSWEPLLEKAGNCSWKI